MRARVAVAAGTGVGSVARGLTGVAVGTAAGVGSWVGDGEDVRPRLKVTVGVGLGSEQARSITVVARVARNRIFRGDAFFRAATRCRLSFECEFDPVVIFDSGSIG